MKAAGRKYLADIAGACRFTTEFVSGKTLTDYLASKLLRSAVERQLIIVGEAMTQLRRIDATTLASITNWRRIIAFRNLAVHGYDFVSDEVVYIIATRDVPALRREVEILLADDHEPEQDEQ